MALVGCSQFLSNIPFAEGTDWISDSAADSGFDPEKLAEMPDFLRREFPHILSVYVQRGGEAIYEYYAPELDSEVATPVYSVTKSVASMLIGIALDEGLIESVDQTLAELIPERIPSNAGSQIQEVTLKQLLTMTTGSYCRKDGLRSQHGG